MFKHSNVNGKRKKERTREDRFVHRAFRCISYLNIIPGFFCRQSWAAFGVRFLLGAEDSVLYSVMPLYHSSGGQIGTACTLTFGNKTVIKAKFSARNFFKDCAKYKVTVRQAVEDIER